MFIHTEDVVVLFGSKTVNRYNLDKDLTSKHREGLEDKTLTFTSPRDK